MASIYIFINPRAKKDGTHSLKLSIHHNRTTIRKDLGIEIPLELWDKQHQRILAGFRGRTKDELNHLINKHLVRATDKIFDLKQNDRLRNMCAKDIENELYNSCLIVQRHSFNSYFREYIARLFDIGRIGNSKTYEYALTSFERFNPSEIQFADFNYLLVRKFDEYLIKRGLSINARGNIHRTIRALYNYAIKELDYVDRSSNPYLDFKVKNEKTKKRNISVEEIRRIHRYDGPHQLAKDMFLFSFFCIGMDVVDMCYLNDSNIENGRIVYNRKKVTKTQREISIKIFPPIQSIIDKYRTGHYVFPFIADCDSDEERYLKHTNARRLYNKQLKEIAAECQIGLSLTSKVSRHSWATIAKRLGASKDVISEMLGHRASGSSTTDIYMDEFDMEVKDTWANRVIEKIVKA